MYYLTEENITQLKKTSIIAIKEEHLNYLIRKEILRLAAGGVTKDCIREYFNGILDDSRLDLIIGYMSHVGNLVRDADKYIASSMYIYDYIQVFPLSDDERDLITKRFNGVKLNDLAKERGMTGEGIRIAEKKILSKLHAPFMVENYKSMYGSYIFKDCFYETVIPYTRFEPEFMDYMFQEDIQFVYARHYFMQCYPGKTEKKESLFKVISRDLPSVPRDLLDAIIDFYSPVIMENGKCFPSFSGDVLAEILNIHGPMTYEDLKEAYKEQKYILSNNSFSPYEDMSERYLKNIFVQNVSVIRTGVKELRYYDFEKYAGIIPETLKTLDFMGKTGKMTTARIYQKNKKKLNEIDINNHYELHSLMRHKIKLLPKNVKIGRVPSITVE